MLWLNRAKINSVCFEEAFRKPPFNQIETYDALDAYKSAHIPLATSDKDECKNTLNKVKGQLISYPVGFLKKEWLHPETQGLVKENIAPAITFT